MSGKIIPHLFTKIRIFVRNSDFVASDMLLIRNTTTIPVSDLFGSKGMKYLKQIELPIYLRQQLKSYLINIENRAIVATIAFKLAVTVAHRFLYLV